MLKTIVVEAQKGFKLFGKNIRPNEVNTLNIRQVFDLLGVGGGIKVFEILPDGSRVRINKSNYDKDNSSSVSSIAKVEVDNKQLEEIKEGIPTQSDVSSNEEASEESLRTEDLQESEEAKVVEEEPETIEEEKQEPINEDSAPESDNVEEEPEEESADNNSANLPFRLSTADEQTGTEEDENVVVEEEDVVEEIHTENVAEEVTEENKVVNVGQTPTANYNMPKKANKYKK